MFDKCLTTHDDCFHNLEELLARSGDAKLYMVAGDFVTQRVQK